MVQTSPSGLQGVISAATVRFRVLVSYFMSPSEEARLIGYRDGEAQLSLERPGKPPVFIVLLDGSREEERSLRLRIGHLASENVNNQHVVVVANHGWMPDALRKIGGDFWPKMSLYQLNSDGGIELKARQPLRPLVSALRAQKRIPLPIATEIAASKETNLANETEAAFAARCTSAEQEKERLRESYADFLKQRPTPVTLLVIGLQAGLLGLGRLLQSGSDSGTVLVQLGAAVPPFVRDGEWWRLLSSAELHVGLLSGLFSLLLLLSLGSLLEKLLGSARFLTLHVLCGLAAALTTVGWPRSQSYLISVGASGMACGLLGAGGVLALDPGGLPPAEVQRLHKIALGGLVMTALLTLLPGVDRPTHLGGVLAGAVLMASGLLRPPPMGRDGKLAESPILGRIQQGVAALCGLALAASLMLAFLRGHPWQPDASWKQRLDAMVRRGRQLGGASAGGNAANAVADDAERAALAAVRRTLGDSGASLELPADLGEAREKAEPGRTPVYEFGDLGDKQQLLAVLVQRHPRLLKKRAQIEAAFSQAVALVKADKLRDDRISVLTPPSRGTLDGWPLMEFHVRVQETVQARGAVQTRSTGTVVLWYVYTDTLPETVQVDLKAALHSLRDGETAPEKTPKPGKKGTKSKKRR